MAPSTSGSGEAAYARLRDAVVGVELAPGTPVSEAQLVEAYGFSKAAIRSALARLRAERLVRSEPRRGHVVAPLTMRDVLEIYDLRLLLEPPAAALAAGRIDRAELARLRELAAAELVVGDRASVEAFMRVNRTVHLAIMSAAGNRRAARIVERLLDDSERARLVALRAGAAGQGLRARGELEALLSALEDADGPRAAELMSAAIEAFRDDLVDALRAAALDMPLGVADA